MAAAGRGGTVGARTPACEQSLPLGAPPGVGRGLQRHPPSTGCRFVGNSHNGWKTGTLFLPLLPQV